MSLLTSCALGSKRINCTGILLPIYIKQKTMDYLIINDPNLLLDILNHNETYKSLDAK